jgi:predicted nucleic acid-binding protein
VPAISPIIILDAGPLKAAADIADPHHLWTMEKMLRRVSPFIITSAAIAEATHILKNGPRALEFLEKLVERMRVEDPAPVAVLAEMRKWEQRMDYADACAVLLARRHKGAVVLTADHRDFSVYRVPFVSPKGEFHG